MLSLFYFRTWEKRGEFDYYSTTLSAIAWPRETRTRLPMAYKLVYESPTTMWCQFSGHVGVRDINDATNDFYHDYRSDHVTKVLWDFMAMTHLT
jgi:hypothetical protein